jgi:hypothetical protein
VGRLLSKLPARQALPAYLQRSEVSIVLCAARIASYPKRPQYPRVFFTHRHSGDRRLGTRQSSGRGRRPSGPRPGVDLQYRPAAAIARRDTGPEEATSTPGLRQRLAYVDTASDKHLWLNSARPALRHTYMKPGVTSRSSAVKLATSLVSSVTVAVDEVGAGGPPDPVGTVGGREPGGQSFLPNCSRTGDAATGPARAGLVFVRHIKRVPVSAAPAGVARSGSP